MKRVVQLNNLTDGLAAVQPGSPSGGQAATAASSFSSLALVSAVEAPRAVTSRRTGRELSVASLALSDPSRALLKVTLWSPRTAWADTDAAPAAHGGGGGGGGAGGSMGLFGHGSGTYTLPLQQGDVVLITDLQPNVWQGTVEAKASSASQVLVLVRQGQVAPALRPHLHRLRGSTASDSSNVPGSTLPIWCLPYISHPQFMDMLTACAGLAGYRLAGSGPTASSSGADATSGTTSAATTPVKPQLRPVDALIAASTLPSGPSTIYASLQQLLDDAALQVGPLRVSLQGTITAVHSGSSSGRSSEGARLQLALEQSPAVPVYIAITQPLGSDKLAALVRKAEAARDEHAPVILTACALLSTSAVTAATAAGRAAASTAGRSIQLRTTDSSDVIAAGVSAIVRGPSGPLSPLAAAATAAALGSGSGASKGPAPQLPRCNTVLDVVAHLCGIPPIPPAAQVQLYAAVTAMWCPAAALSAALATSLRSNASSSSSSSSDALAVSHAAVPLPGTQLIKPVVLSQLLCLCCSRCGCELQPDALGLFRCDQPTCLAVPEGSWAPHHDNGDVGVWKASEPLWSFRPLWLRLRPNSSPERSVSQAVWVLASQDTLTELLAGLTPAALAEALHQQSLLRGALASQAASQWSGPGAAAAAAAAEGADGNGEGEAADEAVGAAAALLMALLHPASEPLQWTLRRTVTKPLSAEGEVHDAVAVLPSDSEAGADGTAGGAAGGTVTGNSTEAAPPRSCILAASVDIQGE